MTTLSEEGKLAREILEVLETCENCGEYFPDFKKLGVCTNCINGIDNRPPLVLEC
jgi:hypothetical protein